MFVLEVKVQYYTIKLMCLWSISCSCAMSFYKKYINYVLYSLVVVHIVEYTYTLLSAPHTIETPYTSTLCMCKQCTMPSCTQCIVPPHFPSLFLSLILSYRFPHAHHPPSLCLSLSHSVCHEAERLLLLFWISRDRTEE